MPRICFNCLREYDGASCGACGYTPDMNNAFPNALYDGYILVGRYCVGKVLGSDINGITYVAKDTATNLYYSIKEYFPQSSAVRQQDGSVLASNENFFIGKTDFISNANALSQNSNSSVKGIFEANNTVYYLSDYNAGFGQQQFQTQSFTNNFNSVSNNSNSADYFRNQTQQFNNFGTQNTNPVKKKKRSPLIWIIPIAAALVIIIGAVIAVSLIMLAPNPAKDFKYTLNSSGTITIEKYIGDKSVDRISVPAAIEEKPVTEIAKDAFKSSSVSDIVIPNTVKKIGNGAFSYSSVKSFSIPDSVTEMGEEAFKSSDIETVTISGSIKKIPANAFGYCNYLKSVTIGKGVSEIGEKSFTSCKKLTTVNINESVKTIGESAFSGCSSIKSISLPNNISSVKKWAFSNCSSLTTVKAYGYLYSGKKGTFASYAFTGCNKLKSITIPRCIKTLGDHFISFSKSVKTVKIQEGVENINQSAFWGCENLKTVSFPLSLKKIGTSAFWDCKKLKKVTIYSKVKTIGKHAFNNCKSLKSIYIPATVKKVSWGAFENCSGVKKIIISSKKTKLGKYVFSGCNKVKSIVVPD